MTERDYQKTKRTHHVLTAAVTILVLLLVALFLRIAIPDPNPALYIETGLKSNISEDETLFIRYQEATYELNGDEFLNILQTTECIETKDYPDPDLPHITLHLAELYEFYFYPDGTIESFDGYSRTFQESTVYHTSSPNFYTQLEALIQTTGTLSTENIGFFK